MSIETALADVRARITAAAEKAGRNSQDVRLIVVTKKVVVDRINEVVDLGIDDIAENRVHEITEKHDLVAEHAAQLSRALHWHFVGHLQTNKAAAVATFCDVVHSVDSERGGAALSRHHDPSRAPLDVLIEVNLTDIPGRSGVSPDFVSGLVGRLSTLPNLRVRGLMTMAPSGGGDVARPFFARLRALRDELGLPDLSMGMSDDFEVAIEEGSTMVRIGRAIFGE